MTSTNDGNDVNINQRSSHKNKSFYIELYKSLEARLNNGESSLEARTAHVCEAWRRVYSLYQHSAPSTHPHLSSWLQRHTAHTVLQSKWAESKNEHVRLTAAIDALVAEVQAAAAGRDLQPWEQLLLQRADWFKAALHNPWGHPVLKSLINPDGEPVTDQQVLEWLIEEHGIVLVTRIGHLVSAGNCDDLALLLASAVMDRARAGDKRNPDEPDDKAAPEEDSTSFMAVLEREASFTVEVWDLLKDIELVLLLKTDKQQRCIELAKLTPLRYGYATIERLRTRLETSPRNKKLWKHAKEVATLVTQVIIARCMVLPQCSGVVRAALYCCSRSLARLVPAARLPGVSNTLAAAAATARHLHTFCTALDAQCSSDMKPFICELYIRAITAGMNELEQLKLNKRQNDETVGSFSQMLANWFTQLGTLLEQSLRLRAECALTAFSVFPARNYYERVADMPQPHNINTTQDPTPETTSEFGSWANDSRTQSNLVKTSETLQIKQTDQHQANVLSTAVLTEGETLGLEPELCQDLAVLLSGPRVKTLSWDMDREVLLLNCRSYMDRTAGGTRAVTTELRFLNLDPSDYCHLPEEDDEETGIEKGYEHELLVEAPEEIWQDAFFDAELTESANDSEVEYQITKKKNKTPAIFSDEDEDPLSNLADAKREKKKLAKEKRKEQRSKKTQKRDTSKEPSKERRKDKEKKTKKERKKDKSEQQITGSLTSLLGMKVTKMSSQVQDGEKRVRKKKERRRDSSTTFSYVSVTDSDYDSQEKLSQISDNDPNIVVDGVFPMDEIKSPERNSDTKPIDNTSAEFKTFGIAKSTVINDIKTRPKVSSLKVSTSDDSDVSRSKSPYLTPNQLSNRHVVSSKVKSSIINKLLQFRRQKQVKPVVRNPAPIQTPTILNQTLVGMKIYNPEEVPKVHMNKKQLETISKEVNNLRNKANEISNNIAPQAYNEPRIDNKLLNLYNVQKQSHDYNSMHGTPLNMNENQKVHTEFIKSPPKLSLHSNYLNQTPAIAHSNYLSPPKIEHATQALNLSPQKPIVTYQPYHKSMQNLSTGNMPELPKKPVLINDPNYHSQQAKNVSQLSPRIISNTCIKPPNQTVTSSQHDTKLAHMSVISKGIQNLNSQLASLNDAARFAPKSLSSSQDVNAIRKEVIKKHAPNDMRYPSTYMRSHSDLVNTALALQASKSMGPSRIQSQDAKIVQSIHATQQKPEIKTHYQEYLNSLAKSMNPSVSVTNQSIHLSKDVKLTPVPNSSTSYKRIESATPQCAKQMIQQKKESAPNTFSRRSYMHKNKQNETKIINDIITAELNKNIIDHKMMKAQLKHDVTISRVSTSNSNLKNQTKIGSNIEQPPKNLQKSYPLLSNMLDSPGKLFEKNQPFTNVASSQSLTETQTDREHADLLLLLRNQPIVKANPSSNVIKSDVTHVPSNTHNKTEQVASTHQTLIGTKVKNINIITPQAEKPTPQHNSTDWEDVMNELLAHKTAPLGPNALDMVLKNDKRRSHSNSRSSQKPRTPGQNSQMKPDGKKRESHDTKSKSSIPKTSTEKHSEAPKRHRQPETSKKTPTIEMVKRPDIQNKHLSSKEDPFISGIPNSAYDMIGDLMDDDLRRELGELSSDEDAYNSANVSVIKGKCSNIPKTTNVCKTPNISKENPHIVNPKTTICKNEINTVNRKTSSTNICPTVITTNSRHTNATRLPENRTVEHTAIITNQIAQPNVNMTNHIIAPNHYVNNMEPANVIIASLPVQAPPVFVIRQELAYDPYPTIRIHESQVTAGLCSVNQNLYTVNTTPNIALYQTTQFAAPVINPVIIGNAMTSTNISEVAMTEEHCPDAKNDDLNPSTQDGIDTSIADRIESKTPERSTNVDFNMNKNCERKVLSQMQEKHVNENVDKDSHIRRLPTEDKPLKSKQDEERIKLKRQFLLNRKTNHACDIGPIPLSYTPLITNVNQDRMMQQETKNGVFKPIVMPNCNNTVETLVSTDRVESPQSAANNENIESPTKASGGKKNKKNTRRWLRSSKKSESKASPVKRARIPLRRNTIKQKVTKKGIQDITDLVKENKDSVKTRTRVSTRILNKNKSNISDSSASTGQQQHMENDEPLDSEDVTPPSPKDETVFDNTELIDFEEELSGSKILKTSLLETTAAQNEEMDEGMDCENLDDIKTENDEPLGITEEIENNLQDTEEPEVVPECKESTNSDVDHTGVIEKLKNQLGNQLIIKSLPSQKASLNRNVIFIKNNTIVKPKKGFITADGLVKVITPATTKRRQVNKKDLSQSSKDSPQVEVNNQSQTLTNNEVLNSKKTLSASSTPSNKKITRTDDKIVPNKRTTRASLLSQKDIVPNAMKATETGLVNEASDAENTNTTTVPEKDSPSDKDKPKSLPESIMQLPNTEIDKIKTPGLVKNKSRQAKVNTRALLRRGQIEEVFCTEGYPNTFAHEEETDMRLSANCQPNNSDQTLNTDDKSAMPNDIPKNTVKSKAAVSKNKSCDANNEVNECRELTKDNVKIEELPSRGPNAKTFRITLPNGKVLKATISGNHNGDFDSLFSQPSMRSILEEGLADGKRYTLKYTLTHRVNKENPSTILATQIQNMKIRDLTPVDTVNLISDEEDEIDTPRAFVTEFGKYTTNVDQETYTQHQKKFSQKCVVKLQKDLVFDTNDTKRQTNSLPTSNSSLLTRTRSRLISQTTVTNVIPKSKGNDECIPVSEDLTDNSQTTSVRTMPSPKISLPNSDETKLLADATTSDMTIECNNKNDDVSLTTADTTIKSTPANEITTFKASDPENSVEYSTMDICKTELEINTADAIPAEDCNTNDVITDAPTPNAPSEPNNTSEAVNTTEIGDKITDILVTEHITPSLSEEVFNETPIQTNTTEVPLIENTDKFMQKEITSTSSIKVSNDNLKKVNETEVEDTYSADTCESLPEHSEEGFNYSLNLVNANEVLVNYNTNKDKSMLQQMLSSPSVEVCNDILKEETTEVKEITPLLMEVTKETPEVMNTTGIVETTKVEEITPLLMEVTDDTPEVVNTTGIVETTKVEEITPLLMEVTDDTPEVVNTTGIVETTKVEEITPLLKEVTDDTPEVVNTTEIVETNKVEEITPLLMEVTDDTPEVVNTTEIVETNKVEEITPLLMEVTDDTPEVANTTGILETTKVEEITPLLMEVTDDTPEVVKTTGILETSNSKTNKSTLSPSHTVKVSNDITEMADTTQIVQIDNTNTDKLIPEPSPSVEISNDTVKELNTSKVEEITPTLLMEVYNDTPPVKTTEVVEMDNSNTDKLMSEQITVVPLVEVSNDTPKVTETIEATEINNLNSDKLIPEKITPKSSVRVSNDTLQDVNTTEVEINHSNTDKLVPKEITTTPAVEVYSDTPKETNATKVVEIDNSNTDKLIEQITPSPSVEISNDNLKVVNAVEIPETDETHADNLIPEQRTNKSDISEVETADVVEIEDSNIEELVPKEITPSLSTEVSNDTPKAADTVEVIEIDDSSNDSVEIITSDESESIEPAKKIYELSDMLLQEYGINITNESIAYPRKKKAAVYNFKNALLQDLGMVPTVTPVIDITDDDDIEVTTPKRPVLPKCYVKLTRCDNLIKRYKLMKTMKRCHVKLERLNTRKIASACAKSEASKKEIEQCTQDNTEDLIEFDVEDTSASPQLSRCPSLSILNDWECQVTPEVSYPSSPVMEIFDTIVQLRNELGVQSEFVIENKELFSLKCDSEWTMTKSAFRTLKKITQSIFMQAVPLTECQNMEDDDKMPSLKAPNLLTITLKFFEANPDLICRLHSTHKLSNQLKSPPNKLKRKTRPGSEGTVANKISKLGTLALNVWHSNPQIMDAYNYTTNKIETKGKEHYEVDVPITNAQYTNRHCNIKNCDLTTEYDSAISTEIDDKPQNTCDLKIHENHPVLASPESNTHSNSDIIEENSQNDKITVLQVASNIEDKKEETTEIEKIQSGKIETNEQVTDSHIVDAPVTNKNDLADIDAHKNLSAIEELNDSLTNIQAISEKTVNLGDLNTSTLHDIEQFGSEKSKNIETKTQVNATNAPITEDILSIENSDFDTEQDSRASFPSLLDNLPLCSDDEMEQRTDSVEEATTESSNTINVINIARMDEITAEDLSDEAYLVEIVVSHEEDEADIIKSLIANQELAPVNIDSSSSHNSSLKSPVFIDSNKIVFNYHDYTKTPKKKENTTDNGDLTQKDSASDDVQTVCNPESNIDLIDHSLINYTSENSQPKAKPERKYELIQEDDLLTVITTENDKEDDEINPAFENSSDSLEDTAIVASVCLKNASINIKGYEYDDVYVFPLSETGSNASNDSINQEFNISVNKRLNDIKDELHDIDFGVIEPRVTYTRKSLKRKIGMRDIKVLAKKYRKGKNIDCPKRTYTSIMESAYSKEYKQLLEYCSSVKFSYARPFHKECVEIDNLVSEWPIHGTCDGLTDDLEDEHLFVNLEEVDSFQPDPATQTLAEEINYEYEQNDAIQENPYSEAGETNFNMGFGEGSGRVIQNLKKVGESNISAATLSDVKQSQPVLKSVDFDDSNNIKTSEDDQIKKIRQHVNFIELRDKVRSFFKKCSVELKYDWIQQNIKDFKSTNNDRFHAEQFPFDLCSLEYVKPMPTETIVQVVQVGQLPVSAAAQNPVTCDPRVTQVSNASPSQCSVDNSPNDDSQSEIKTEYTELTTADLTLPLQEYAQQNQAMNLSSHDDNIELREQTISLEMEIKAEESPEIKEEMPDIKDEKSNSSDTELHTLTNATPDHMEYAYKNNNDKSETASVIYETPEQNESETFPQQRQQNGTSEKTDQIAHAMNAAGITTTPETVTNTRAHALVNILSQKIRHGSVNTTQTTTNTYSKTTSINAMALQQALAQILPPPLNQTGSGENNQTSSTNVGPQVLHIVQGKNASGNQITLVDNSQQSVISAPNTQVLHIVQNKGAASGQASNGTLTPQTNSFSGLSLVDAGLQQGGNQLLHIVNTGNQKNASPGQLLKRVNLLTNLQGSNEQKMVQFVCKSADGKAIQLNAPHQRSMVLRLQPIETPNVQASKSAESQELSQSPTSSASKDSASQQEIKSRSIYEENYAKFIQNSSTKTPGSEKSTSLPKFNQAFGKPVFQEGNQKQGEATGNNLPSVNTNSENAECPANDNAINLEHIGQISSPPLLLRKQTAVTSQSQSNIVQQIKQTIAPMNIQTMHGGVIYTRQIPVNIGGGQTINLITVPSTELINDDAPKTQTQISQGEIEPSIIKIVPQSQNTTSTEGTQEDSNNQSNGSNENAQTPQPQPVLTQMRIKLPMLSKAPQMVPGARVVRPSFFQIQRNVIGGANQPVYQQLVLTAAPPLGQQTIRLPTAQASRTIKVHSDSQSSSSESQMSSSTLEQLREFDMVLEQVKERSTVQPGTNSNSNFKIHTSSSDTTDGNASSNCSTESTPQQVLYSIGNNQSLNVAYVNRKATVTTPTTSTYVRSPDSSGIADSPTSSSHGQIPHTVTSDSSPTEMSSQSKPAKVGSKSKSRPKSTSNPPNTLKLNSVPPKTSSQKPLEDEQTTQRILYILAEYKEQVENSPDKDKPAPRRRSNPPSNPGSSKRKKSSSSRRSGTRDMSPVHGEDTCRTMGSEDSSCGTSQGDCNESCLDSHSPQDSPRKVARKITFDQDLNVTQRPQPHRNVIVADGQTITVARGTTGKPATAVLMPANYILPVSMVKGGQQIAIVTNRGPKLLTVGGEGGATNALLLQRLIGPAGLKPVLTRPGVRHVRLPTAALHNLQAFNLATATTVQPPDSTASPTPGPTPPELVDTRATSSPWTDRGDDVKPERGSSPEGSEPWNLPSSADHEYTYEETVRTDNMDRTVLVVQKKDGSQRQHRIAHVSAAALRHKYAILEHELRLQKSLSEECEDLGVDSPSASELFPEAELLFATSPAHEHNQDPHREHTPQPLQSTIPQPDMDDQIATDHLIPREIDIHGLGDVGIVAVSSDGMQTTIALDQEEFARSHPNTTFHSEPTDGEVQPFTITGLKGRHITSTIFHSASAPATVLMAAPQATVISQAPDHSVKYEIENMINSMPSSHNNDINLSSVLVKDDGLTRFDNILTDSRELHLTNTASAIVHSSGNATQVIRRVCYEDDKRERDTRYLIDEPDNLIAGDDAKMVAEDSSRDATLESMADVDDDRSSPERHAELFWESNSASERSESRRPLDFSSDSDKCCKSPSFDETNSTDSSGVGTHMRLDSVIKEARGRERSGSADGSSADDTHPPLRTYPPKRMYHPLEGEVERSLSGKTRAGERSPDSLEVRRRASGRGVVKRGCHCCNGSPAPPRPKKPRQRKPTLDFTTNN